MVQDGGFSGEKRLEMGGSSWDISRGSDGDLEGVCQ
jgi:hypothetical protein